MNIRPITLEDFPAVLSWSQDKAFCSANDWEMNREPQELFRWWERLVKGIADDFIRLGIEMDGKLIGYVDFTHIIDGSGEFGIAIGDSSLWGQGLGPQAALNAMDFASTTLGITTFTAETHESNLRSRRLLKKIGFVEISRIGSEMYMGEDTRLIQLRHTVKRRQN
ncbi:GNAT family N-acetyltransferase [Chungangia koreensis]|uniref:GNAT family N-acetyltransferase n=1 Tax=Chungangia koreensis TaxID=752657 RepID=A0ABV8X1B1_9LACT